MWEVLKAKRDSMRKSLGHLLNRNLSRGWGAWVEMAVERAAFMQKLRKGLSRMVNRKLAVGLLRGARRAAPRDDPMSKALSYFLNRELARGWVAWHSTWAVLKAKRESMRKSLGHLLNRGLSRGWGAWLEMAQERAEFMQKLRKGLSFIVNRKLAVGLQAGRSRLRSCMRRTSQHMSRALLHLLHRELSRGWSGWHSTWLKLVAQRESMRKSLGHLLHRGLSRGWGAWVEMAVERAAFMQKLRKGAGHMMNRKLCLAFLRGWRECDRSARRPDVEGSASSAQSRAERAAGRCWHAMWEVLKAKRDSMRKSLGHLLNRNLSRGWGAWVEMAVERAAFMQKLRKGLSRMVNRKLALGYVWVARGCSATRRPDV